MRQTSNSRIPVIFKVFPSFEYAEELCVQSKEIIAQIAELLRAPESISAPNLVLVLSLLGSWFSTALSRPIQPVASAFVHAALSTGLLSHALPLTIDPRPDVRAAAIALLCAVCVANVLDARVPSDAFVRTVAETTVRPLLQRLTADMQRVATADDSDPAALLSVRIVLGLCREPRLAPLMIEAGAAQLLDVARVPNLTEELAAAGKRLRALDEESRRVVQQVRALAAPSGPPAATPATRSLDLRVLEAIGLLPPEHRAPVDEVVSGVLQVLETRAPGMFARL